MLKNQWAERLLGVDGIEHTAPLVRIGLLDTGIAPHSNIPSHLSSTDEDGHGTACMSLLLSLAPDAYYHIETISSHYISGDEFYQSISKFLDDKLDILVLSMGQPQPLSYHNYALLKQLSKETIILASSGNSMAVNYPSNYPEVWSIGAINKGLQPVPSYHQGKVDFCAPGINLWMYGRYDNEVRLSGTSFANAYAAGVIALLIQGLREHGMNDDKKSIYNLLASSTINLGSIGKDHVSGYGLINLKKAIQAAQ